jgi:hypothetical protein
VAEHSVLGGQKRSPLPASIESTGGREQEKDGGRANEVLKRNFWLLSVRGAALAEAAAAAAAGESGERPSAPVFAPRAGRCDWIDYSSEWSLAPLAAPVCISRRV